MSLRGSLLSQGGLDLPSSESEPRMLGRPPASYAPGRPCEEWGLDASTLASCATPRLSEMRYPTFPSLGSR